MKVFGGRNENLKNPQKMKLQQRPGPGGCHNDGETGEVTGSEVSPNWLLRAAPSCHCHPQSEKLANYPISNSDILPCDYKIG